jgi:hypothetical protein
MPAPRPIRSQRRRKIPVKIRMDGTGYMPCLVGRPPGSRLHQVESAIHDHPFWVIEMGAQFIHADKGFIPTVLQILFSCNSYQRVVTNLLPVENITFRD